jgi:cell wall-associated NlpC family hydrolase
MIRKGARHGTRGLALAGIIAVLAACSTVPVGPPGVTARMPPREAPPPEPPAPGQRVVEVAMQHRGAPYRWGGEDPSGFDCSGFVRYVYAQVGLWLPHNAAQQYRYGTPVARDRLEPGDLVFFDRLRHNGIYIGQGRFIHSRQTGKRVGVGDLDDDWYRSRWVGARRPWTDGRCCGGHRPR